MTLRTLNPALKVLFSCYLLTIGIGYLFAILYLFLVDVEPHAHQGGGLIEGVILKYYGNRGGTRLQAALEGAMGDNVTPAQREQIFRWLRKGAREPEFGAIQPIFQGQCAGCHSKESGLPIAPLTTFSEVAAYARVDTGESIKTLVRVSHVHLFGMSFIFMLAGGIFALSEMAPLWRSILIAIPFVAVWIDIGSWWFTRLQPAFAYTVVIGGALMGLALAVQILRSLWEMWWPQAPVAAAGRAAPQ